MFGPVLRKRTSLMSMHVLSVMFNLLFADTNEYIYTCAVYCFTECEASVWVSDRLWPLGIWRSSSTEVRCHLCPLNVLELLCLLHRTGFLCLCYWSVCRMCIYCLILESILLLGTLPQRWVFLEQSITSFYLECSVCEYILSLNDVHN